MSIKKRGGQFKKIDINKAIELNKKGLTRKEIGKILGVSKNTLTERFKEAGWVVLRDISKKLMGENNARWNGEKASIKAKHLRLVHRFGCPKRCDFCGTTDTNRTYDWANLSHDYDDDSQWRRLCRSCHSKHDKIHKNLGKYSIIGIRWKHKK